MALVAGGVICVIYSQRGSSGGDTARSELPAGHSAYGAVDMKTQAAAALSVAAREAFPADTSSSRAAAVLASATDNPCRPRATPSRAGDLTTARRRFSKIPASQLSAANVQRTQADLGSLERARDEML